MRTRVGYSGGTKDNPTYHSLGDHSETIEVDYDPSVLTYEDLLEVFWDSHNPHFPSYSRQYASVIFYHDEEQRRLAEETKAAEATRRGGEIYTEVVAYREFYLAEDYHQKYELRQRGDVAKEYLATYPDLQDFVNSTAVARVNGYLGGNGNAEQLQRELDLLGLSEAARQSLLKLVR